MKLDDDLRRDLAAADYAATEAEFLALCAAGGIPAGDVAFFGTVSAPGISDIDAAVVASAEQIHRLRERFRDWVRASATRAYLFWHEPVWILEDVRGEAGCLHSLAELRPVISGGRADELRVAPADMTPAERAALHLGWYVLLLKVWGRCVERPTRGRSGCGWRCSSIAISFIRSTISAAGLTAARC